MINILTKFSLFCLFTVFTSSTARAQAHSYEQSILDWRQERLASLKSENGWLNLAGLFWLEEGVNSFGAGKTNKVVFPEGKCPELLGLFTLKNGEVWMEPAPAAAITANGKYVATSIRVFPSDTPVAMQSGSLRWFVIKRENKYGIRLRDLEHPALSTFTGVDNYPVDSSWRLRAYLEPAVDKKIPIANVLGQTLVMPSPGTLVFTLNGVACRLDALQEGEELFIIFSDETSGVETYGAGRFLYAGRPGPDGLTTLDFNKATNPPCAFTAFATCPLPPLQNAMPIAVTAGERKWGH